MITIHELLTQVTNETVARISTVQYIQYHVHNRECSVTKTIVRAVFVNHCRRKPCDVFVDSPKSHLPVECLFFPRWLVMHNGGNKMNLNITDLFLQETYTSTGTNRPRWASTGVSSHMHHTGLRVGGLVETE